MSKIDKVFAKLMSGKSDANFAFADLVFLLSKLGFQMRQNGSHVVCKKDAAFVTIQDFNGKAKTYQLSQIREELKKHNIKPL